MKEAHIAKLVIPNLPNLSEQEIINLIVWLKTLPAKVKKNTEYSKNATFRLMS